ncbi:PDGLE domain-containing protein [Janibacter corallicola]|uniref:PDGLE domain-containing protein n=1 Tax=Janibacter corallicola TaxID=415212 RepID=UPI00082A5A3B|nr:PDGLE domain-containing protein [Janibacter corallicola]
MRPRTTVRTVVLVGVVVALLLAGVVSFYASSSPDGLEHVAAGLGFADTAGEHASSASPLADYGIAGVDSDRLSGGLAGIIGVVVVGVLMFGLTRLLHRRGTGSSEED